MTNSYVTLVVPVHMLCWHNEYNVNITQYQKCDILKFFRIFSVCIFCCKKLLYMLYIRTLAVILAGYAILAPLLSVSCKVGHHQGAKVNAFPWACVFFPLFIRDVFSPLSGLGSPCDTLEPIGRWAIAPCALRWKQHTPCSLALARGLRGPARSRSFLRNEAVQVIVLMTGKGRCTAFQPLSAAPLSTHILQSIS